MPSTCFVIRICVAVELSDVVQSALKVLEFVDSDHVREITEVDLHPFA